MEIKLVKSRKKELPLIARIYIEEFSKPPYNEKWTIKKAEEKMNFYYRFYDLYSIKTNNKLVGFIAINPNFMCPGEVAFVEEIAINKNFQRKGIGTRVFKLVFKIYKEKGFKRFMGIVNIKSGAFKLYKKLGILPSKKDLLIEKKLK